MQRVLAIVNHCISLQEGIPGCQSVPGWILGCESFLMIIGDENDVEFVVHFTTYTLLQVEILLAWGQK